jgi:hypothetical protein
MLKMLGVATGYLIVVVLLFILVFLAGLYCVQQHWRAFRDNAIASGEAAKTAQHEWRRIYPSVD